MLKGIDPLLTPDLLKVLAEMGHGDEIVIADANFTAASLARRAAMAPLPVIALPGADVRRTVAAVLSLLPLDASVAQPVAYMQVCDTPVGYRSRLQRDVIAALQADGQVFTVGTSIGLAAVTPDMPTVAAVLHAADTACYAAKRGGRNQVVCYAPPVSGAGAEAEPATAT